jgi:CDP-paratose 2-epimerase
MGDVRDGISVIDAVRAADAVFHLAAQVAVTTSLVEPFEDFEVNARGTLNVLEAVRLHNPRAPVMFASTNKVYGRLIEDHEVRRVGQRCEPMRTDLETGVDERTPLDFYSPYGCSKGTADQYVRDYARIYGLNSVVLRMSCIYGPRQFGTEDQGWLAHFVLSAIRGQPITIYGDGFQVRDALHVADAADAWIAALDHIDTVRGRIFNLGGGPANATSLLELLDMIAALRDERPAVGYAKPRPGDQPWYVSNLAAIGAALGWQPQIGLAQGLPSLLAWIEERFGIDATKPVEARA